MENKSPPTYRKEYMAARARNLITFEAPGPEFKYRLYLAAEMRRLSFNAWFSEYVQPLLDGLMDKQDVPSDPKDVYRRMAQFRPSDKLVAELLTGKAPKSLPKRHNLRRT